MQRFYDALDAEAEDTEEGRVYTGFITKVFNTLRLPSPYYSRLRYIMLEMRSIEQLRRGARTSPSKFRLIQRPSAELFADTDFDVAKDPKFEMVRVHQELVNQQLRDLRTRVEEVDLRQLADVLEGLNERIAALEALVLPSSQQKKETNQ